MRTCLDDHRRSKLAYFMMQMYRYNMLTDEDLERFSDELREQVVAGASVLGPRASRHGS